jgi:cytoskeletal protein CcmA (bactofilin family)
MLDNFRKRDVPQSTRLQSPYSRLQEALSAAGDESASAEAFGIEAPKADLRGGAEPSRSGGETVSKLIVGPDIKLKGAEITDCDTLVVEGRVEASMDSRVIQIAEHGVFVGKAGIDVAEIRGRFEGELTARKQLIIRATGKLSGKVRYGKVAIEEGGELSGDIAALPETKGAAGAARASDPGRSPTATPAAPAQTQTGPQPLPSKPAWTSQTGAQPQPSKPAGASQGGAQPQPSKPAGAPQGGAQPQPNKPAAPSH